MADALKPELEIQDPGLKPSSEESEVPGLKPGASTRSGDAASAGSAPEEESANLPAAALSGDVESAESAPEEEPASIPPSAAQRMGHPGVHPGGESSGSATSASPVGKTAEKKADSKSDAKKDKPKEESASPISITVGKVYDGPMDLLLDLIRKQDIDIYDIPIAKITAQFLAYVEQLKATDVDTAGEFIYTASLLIHIKSKMLLPRSPVEIAEGEAEDPRRELVERLLEHERFKNAAQMLSQKQIIEESTWSNPSLKDFRNDEGTEQEIAADTVDLVRVFREILDRLKQRPVLNVEEDTVTVGQMIDYVRRRLVVEERPVSLRKLLANAKSERTLIALFLALLELVRLQAILLRQEQNFSDILVKKHAEFEQVMTERMNLMRDDWS